MEKVTKSFKGTSKLAIATEIPVLTNITTYKSISDSKGMNVVDYSIAE